MCFKELGRSFADVDWFVNLCWLCGGLGGGRRAGLMLCSMVKKQDTQQARDVRGRRLHFFNIDKRQDAAQFKIG